MTAFSGKQRLSIVMPVLNEAATIMARLAALAPLRAQGVELVVVDGGSDDGTHTLASALADLVLDSPRGRALQMNAGAKAARGDILLFLHADTHLPQTAMEDIPRALERSANTWGRFDVAIEGRHPFLPLVAVLMNFRSRVTGIATGDQALFVCRGAFVAVGGFPPIPLMEDIALSKLLRRKGQPVCLRSKVITSGRRWDTKGFWRTVVLMWTLRLAFAVGVSPRRLARLYGYE